MEKLIIDSFAHERAAIPGRGSRPFYVLERQLFNALIGLSPTPQQLLTSPPLQTPSTSFREVV